MIPVPKSSHGYGMPAYLPDNFMSAEEVRAIGERSLGLESQSACSVCGRYPYRGVEKAHILRRGMGGKPKGTTGPTLRLCHACHYHVDNTAGETLAIRRDGMVCLVTESGDVRETGVAVWS